MIRLAVASSFIADMIISMYACRRAGPEASSQDVRCRITCSMHVMQPCHVDELIMHTMHLHDRQHACDIIMLAVQQLVLWTGLACLGSELHCE